MLYLWYINTIKLTNNNLSKMNKEKYRSLFTKQNRLSCLFWLRWRDLEFNNEGGGGGGGGGGGAARGGGGGGRGRGALRNAG